MKFNTSFINVISFILSIIIVFSFNYGMKFLENKALNYSEKINIQAKDNTVEKNVDNIINEVALEKIEKDNLPKYDWYLEIPKIELYAPIEEGTDDEVLNRAIGHFTDTAKKDGNCGLAGHNRGYDVNYFARLKELKEGDEIFYYIDEKKYEYRVKECFIIYETDWSVLEDNEEEDIITLITCVENREEYRLCVKCEIVNN